MANSEVKKSKKRKLKIIQDLEIKKGINYFTNIQYYKLFNKILRLHLFIVIHFSDEKKSNDNTKKNDEPPKKSKYHFCNE